MLLSDWLMGLRRNKEREINFPRTKSKLKHNTTIPLGYIKSSPSGKFIVLSAHFKHQKAQE